MTHWCNSTQDKLHIKLRDNYGSDRSVDVAPGGCVELPELYDAAIPKIAPQLKRYTECCNKLAGPEPITTAPVASKDPQVAAASQHKVGNQQKRRRHRG